MYPDRSQMYPWLPNQNQFQQQQPQFQHQYPQLQNFQNGNQNQQMSQMYQLHGKVVGSINDIVVNDVRTDGGISLFPTKDYSCIYAKQWGNDGGINTIKYVPEKPVNVEDPNVIFQRNVIERLERIEQNMANAQVVKAETVPVQMGITTSQSSKPTGTIQVSNGRIVPTQNSEVSQ